MAPRASFALVALMAFSAGVAPAAPPGKPDPYQKLRSVPLFTADTVELLEASLRNFLVTGMPNPLYEARPGWGKTANVANGMKWRGQGLRVRPELQYARRNDGNWQHVRLVALHPADTLVCDLRDVQSPEPGRLTFNLFLSFDSRLDYRTLNWESGIKLYDGSLRARFRARLLLTCELTARLEDGGGLLPDAVFRLRVTGSRVEYDNLVVEHVAGVGGELAKLIGSAVRGGIRQWHPSLERELLARVEASLVKAADTKDVRLGFSKLLER